MFQTSHCSCYSPSTVTVTVTEHNDGLPNEMDEETNIYIYYGLGLTKD